MDERQRRQYRNTRSRIEVLDRFREVQWQIPEELRELFRWFLKETNQFPNLSKAINYELPVEKVTARGGTPIIQRNPETETPTPQKFADFSGEDLSQVASLVEDVLFSHNNEHSYRTLASLRPPETYRPVPTVEQLEQSFLQNNYFISKDDIFAIHQAIVSAQPIVVDGPPGTGKTELAQQITIAMGLDPHELYHMGSLFCTPDISKGESIYSWNDARRLMDQQLIKDIASRLGTNQFLEIYKRVAENAYSERYLDIQVLLRHCIIPFRTVVLLDEVDKTYPEFDNYLLDILINNNFKIPEYGRIGRSDRRNFEDLNSRPIFVLTSNRERELSIPLLRRCKPLWYDYLPENLETKVIHTKCGIPELPAGQVAHFFHRIRTNENLHLQQPPSTAEVIETVKAIKTDTSNQNWSEVFSPVKIFTYHCHWIKNRRDFDSIRKAYARVGQWVNSI